MNLFKPLIALLAVAILATILILSFSPIVLSAQNSAATYEYMYLTNRGYSPFVRPVTSDRALNETLWQEIEAIETILSQTMAVDEFYVSETIWITILNRFGEQGWEVVDVTRIENDQFPITQMLMRRIIT